MGWSKSFNLPYLQWFAGFVDAGRLLRNHTRTVPDLRYVILPILNQFPLLTVKALDLKDFIAALEIKGQYLGRLPELSYNKILAIKKGMNTGKNIDENQLSSIVSNVNISSCRVCRRSPPSGTFGIKNLVPYFQIAQHNRSVSE